MTSLIVFGEYLCHQMGGAERSTREIVERLSRRPGLAITPVSGVCRHYQATRDRIPYEGLVEIPVKRLSLRLPFLQYALNSRDVADYFRRVEADVLFANAQAAPMAVNAFGGPSVYFIHDEMSLNVYRTYETSAWKRLKFAVRFALDAPFVAHYRRENLRAMRGAALVVANSRYMADRAERLLGVRPVVVYPQIDVATLSRVELPPLEERPFIMMVGDSEVKGAGTFRKIAAAMPEERFLAVGRGYSDGQDGNITLRGFASDPVSYYRHAKLVLLPSTWEEGFGMVSVEAGALGIPAVVSDRGGLPETVPSRDQVVGDYRDPESWVTSIRRVLDDHAAWSASSREHAGRFDGGRQLDVLVEAVREATGVSLG
ncbi:MAG: glycosyltransferase family 4 protein [Candidatus Eisenbacteria bacterium]